MKRVAKQETRPWAAGPADEQRQPQSVHSWAAVRKPQQPVFSGTALTAHALLLLHKTQNGARAWLQWDAEQRDRQPQALAQVPERTFLSLAF